MTTDTKQKRQRSCVVCRKQDSKHDLFRIVRTSDGNVEFDPTGKVAGRGAYVCSRNCFEQAIATKQLERALRSTVDTATREKLGQAIGPAL